MLGRIAIVLAFIVGTLTGCTSVQVSPADALGATSKQLGTDTTQITLQTPARFALADPGDRYADFTLGLYTQTKTDLVLFEYESTGKTFRKVRVIPLRDITTVSMATWGMFGQIRQVQLAVAGKVLVVNCSNSSDAVGGSIEATQPVIDRLVEAGVKRGDSADRILPEELRCYSTPIPIIKK